MQEVPVLKCIKARLGKLHTRGTRVPGCPGTEFLRHRDLDVTRVSRPCICHPGTRVPPTQVPGYPRIRVCIPTRKRGAGRNSYAQELSARRCRARVGIPTRVQPEKTCSRNLDSEHTVFAAGFGIFF
eukprot:1969895-Rhodomonas_salina.2